MRLGGGELLGAPSHVLDRVRGGRIAMIFQDPASSLNPVHHIGRQVAEALALHRGLAGAAARARARRLLDQIGIPDTARRLDAYPHELSGGQNQRVMIAMPRPACASPPRSWCRHEGRAAAGGDGPSPPLYQLPLIRTDAPNPVSRLT